jgi:predicted PurR-regulated permease PerM
MILLPFVTPVLWAIIIAVSVSPIYDSLNRRMKNTIAATIIVLVFLFVLIIPSYFFFSSIVGSVSGAVEAYKEGGIEIPPPNDKVADWPLIGGSIYDAWSLAAENLENAVMKYEQQVTSFGKWLVSTVSGVAIGVLQFILSIIIAGVLLATPGTRKLNQKLFIKLVGDKKGNEFADLAEKTIRNVTKGILGVAVIQSMLLGILFFMAGVPHAGIWTLLVLILGIIQLPPTIVSLPIIIWLFSATSPGMATVWTVLILAASISDNVLKPILLGKGAPVPMLVIFLGAIGGFILSGFLGLFTGAIVMSLGYKLFIAWIDENRETSTEKELETE